MKSILANKRILALAVALVILVASSVGGTIAWFTDSVSTARNTIQSGNLDMKVSYKTYGAENKVWTEVGPNTKIFDDEALYEPGYTEAVWFKIENAGSLAFRYNLNVDVYDETAGVNKAGDNFKLSDSLVVLSGMNTTDFKGVESFYDTRAKLVTNYNWNETKLSEESVAVAANNVLYSEDNTQNGDWNTAYVCVVLRMPETVGNEANHNGTDIPKIELGLNAVATQVPYEDDAFGSDYDAGAEYPAAGAVELTAWEEHFSVNEDTTRENMVAEDYVEICHNSGNLTLKNVTFKNGLTIFTNNVNNNGSVTMENCTIYLNDGTGDPDYTSNTQHIADYGLNLNLVNGSDITFNFKNCIFTAAADHVYTGNNSYNVYIAYSADSITFTGCTFEGSGKHGIGCSSLSAGNPYDGVASQYYNLTVTGCNFKNWNNSNQYTNGAAIRGNLPSADFAGTINISGNTFGDCNNSTQSTVAIDSWTGSWT